jgi:hypothetical protein
MGVLSLGGEAGASSWQEVHATADDVRIEVAPDGIATVQHHLRYRVVAGHFKTFEIAGLDPRAELLPDAVFTSEKAGTEVAARVETVAKTPGTVRIVIDEGKGLGRGAYLVDVKYRLDLARTKMLVRDGAMWKLSWTAPPAPEGRDGASVVFDLPAAPTEPRLAGETSTTLPTLRRGPERDELELVRAHVPRGEAVVWSARVDPKAFPLVKSPDLRTIAPLPEPPIGTISKSHVVRALLALGLALLAGLFAFALRMKEVAVDASARATGATPRPLVPIGLLRPYLYGITGAAALAMLLWSSPTFGAVLVLLAMALAADRAPAPVVRPRAPAVWQRAKDTKALLAKRVALPIDAFDLSSRRARLLFAALALVVAALAYALRMHVPQIQLALPMASIAIVPLFVTATRAQLPRTAVDLAQAALRPVRDALAARVDLTHVELGTIARTSADGTIDEVRLVCMPRDRTPGLSSIEVALAVASSGAYTPEILVRFDDGSPAAERILGRAYDLVVTGRVPEEKVLRITCGDATASAVARELARLLGDLEGRRMSDRNETPRAYRGPERRKPRAPMAILAAALKL